MHAAAALFLGNGHAPLKPGEHPLSRLDESRQSRGTDAIFANKDLRSPHCYAPMEAESQGVDCVSLMAS